LEATRDRLRAQLQKKWREQFDKVVALLPRAKERYEAVINSLGDLPLRH
jgi:hypothetical protein